jgi:SAM-dependent methyltransferase
MFAGRIANRFLSMLNLELKRKQPNSYGYIPAIETVTMARRDGVSVGDYVERLWGVSGLTKSIIDRLYVTGCFARCTRVCEIGPGTGRYLALTIKAAKPLEYEFYETAQDWAEWLHLTYGPIARRRHADGLRLKETETASCSLVCSYGVFVYLPFLHTFRYLAECERVVANGGYIVFDCFTEEEFRPDLLDRWQRHALYPVIIPREILMRQCQGLSLVDEFPARNGPGESRFFVFQKK